MTAEKIKQKKIEGLSTEVIERTLATLAGPEAHEKSAEYPLGGLVHYEGIGQVSVQQLRGELARRQVGA